MRDIRFMLANGSPVEVEKARKDRREILLQIEQNLVEMDEVAVMIAQVATLPEAIHGSGLIWDGAGFEEIRKGYEKARDMLMDEIGTELRQRGLPIDLMRTEG